MRSTAECISPRTARRFAFRVIALLSVVFPIIILPVAHIAAAEDLTSAIAQVLARNGFRVAFEGAPTQSFLRLDLLWKDTATAVSETQIGTLELQSVHRSNEMMPRQRSQQIQSGQLLVAVIDRANVIRFWRVIADPRASFSETSSALGQLTKTMAPRNDVRLEIVVPTAIEPSEIRILRPSWNEAGQLDLAQLATLSIAPDVSR